MKPGYVEFAISTIDANGALVTGLRPTDFAVSDSSKSYPIAYFQETNAKMPASLVIVGDTSGTMFNKTVVASGSLRTIRGAIDRAMDQVNDCDEVAVVVGGGSYPPGVEPSMFGLPPSLDEVTLVQPFTTDHPMAIAKIENIMPHGPNRLPGAIRVAQSQLTSSHYPARAMVVMTDGMDATAIDESARLLEQARSEGISIWIIGIGDPDASMGMLSAVKGTSRIEVAQVKRLAAAGNAQLLLAHPVDEDGGASLAQAISTIGNQLGQGYAIGVVASPDAKLKVALTKSSEVTLRTAIVPPKVLADAAARPVPPPAPRCLAAGESQPPSDISSKPGYTQVRISVTDADGIAVRELKKADFVVTSESKQLPVTFAREDQNDVVKSIVIAIDTSGSMQNKLPALRSGLAKLLHGLGPCDEVALIAFSGSAFVLQKLTTDHRVVESRLGLLHAYGATALYDAINRSLEMLAEAKARSGAVILITDGIDNVSKASQQDTIAAVQHAHVPIYAIGIGDASVAEATRFGPFVLAGSDNSVDKQALDSIAVRTHGMEFIVPPMEQDAGRGFASALVKVGERLNNGYELGYLAPAPDASPAITIVSHPDYVVRIVVPPAPSDAVNASSD